MPNKLITPKQLLKDSLKIMRKAEKENGLKRGDLIRAIHKELFSDNGK